MQVVAKESDLPWQRHLRGAVYMYGLSMAGIEDRTPQLIAPLVKDSKADIILFLVPWN
ncbi:MAG TPA: hypothetical protein V6C71_14430 [Coleofasciculaceae cyanobacterium]